MSKLIRQQKISQRLIPSKEKMKSDQVLFIICIIIAFVFWGLIKLSDQYTITYTFHIKYANAPANKKLTRYIDSTINLSLKSRGFKILELELFEDMDLLSIDLNNYNIIHKEGDQYFIYTQPIEARMSELVEIPETEINLSKTTLAFVMEDLHSKVVPILGRQSYAFREQFDLYEEVLIQPSHITVYGPEMVLDTLSHVYTEATTVSDIDHSQLIDARLVNPIPTLLRLAPDEVKIRINVEKFTESVFEIPIDLSDIDVKVRTFPSAVKVYFKVAQKDYNSVHEALFKVSPMLDQDQLKQSDKLRLQLTAKPDFVRNIRIVPAEVEFLIIK